MKARISSNISIIVSLFMKEQFKICTEDDGWVQSLKAEVFYVRKAIKLIDEPKHKHKNNYQGRKDSFDSPWIKVYYGKLLV